MSAIKDVLIEEGYLSEQKLLKEVTLLMAYSRIEQYQAECEYFQDKYKMSLKKFDDQLHKSGNKEDFQKEEDFEDWEFSSHALDYWKQKMDDIKRNA